LGELDPQSPSNTMWPGPRPTYVPSGILINPAIWPQQTWAEIWEGLCPLFFGGGELGSRVTQCRLGRRLASYQCILIHPAVWPQYIDRNLGVLLSHTPFGGRSNTVVWAEAYLRTKWHIDPTSHLASTWAENWGRCAPWVGGSGSPSNTMWPGSSPTSVPSYILLHAALWRQYKAYNVVSF